MRKRVVLFAGFFIFFVFHALSQEPVDRPQRDMYGLSPQINEIILGKLGFSDREIGEVLKIYEDARKSMEKYRAEIDVDRARLRKLLLSSDADMKEVEKLLRDSMDWEFKMRMAQIKRELEVRKLVGDKKWVRLVRFLRNMREREIRGGTFMIPGNLKEKAREKRIRELLMELERLVLPPKSGFIRKK